MEWYPPKKLKLEKCLNEQTFTRIVSSLIRTIAIIRASVIEMHFLQTTLLSHSPKWIKTDTINTNATNCIPTTHARTHTYKNEVILGIGKLCSNCSFSACGGAVWWQRMRNALCTYINTHTMCVCVCFVSSPELQRSSQQNATKASTLSILMFLFAPPFSFFVAFNFRCYRVGESAPNHHERTIVSERKRDRAEQSRAYGFLNFIYKFEFFIFRPRREVRQEESAFCHQQCTHFCPLTSTLWFLLSQSNARNLSLLPPRLPVCRPVPQQNFHFVASIILLVCLRRALG